MSSDAPLTEILSPTSPTMASAVFGSSPRSRRPSTSGSLSQQPDTPQHKGKALPPLPDHAQPQTPKHARSPRSKKKANDATRRPDSPDVETMMKRTPRPRRQSSATFTSSPVPARSRSGSAMAVPSSWRGSSKRPGPDDDNESIMSEDYGTLLDKDASMDEKLLEGDGSESDSSIDIHTPLPHLMFRDGLLSPRSKLLPGGGSSTLSLYMDDGGDRGGAPVNRANSVLSVASTAGSTMTKSGIHRDPRDTERRRIRHRDQGLLRAGMGLTTGLGWSDSEDEDAPSLLTRRLIKTNLERQPSVYSTTSRAPSQLSKSTSTGNLSRAPSAFSSSPLTARSLSRSVSSTFSQNRLSGADSDSITSVDLPRPTSRSRTQSNASASSVVSSGSRESSTAAQSVTGSPSAPARTGVPRPLRLPQTAGIQSSSSSSVTRSTSIAESRPPVSSATARIAGSSSGSSLPPPRSRTVSNPGSRPMHGHTNAYGSSVAARATPAVSRMVPPRSVSTSVMAPVRSMSVSALSPVERSSIASASASANDPLSEFPLPPGLASSQSAGGLPRPIASYAQKPAASSPSPAAGTRPQVGLRPRPGPRTGTGMVYRNSSYTSFLDTSRTSRASSVLSSGKEVGVM